MVFPSFAEPFHLDLQTNDLVRVNLSLLLSLQPVLRHQGLPSPAAASASFRLLLLFLRLRCLLLPCVKVAAPFHPHLRPSAARSPYTSLTSRDFEIWSRFSAVSGRSRESHFLDKGRTTLPSPELYITRLTNVLEGVGEAQTDFILGCSRTTFYYCLHLRRPKRRAAQPALP